MSDFARDLMNSLISSRGPEEAHRLAVAARETPELVKDDPYGRQLVDLSIQEKAEADRRGYSGHISDIYGRSIVGLPVTAGHAAAAEGSKRLGLNELLANAVRSMGSKDEAWDSLRGKPGVTSKPQGVKPYFQGWLDSTYMDRGD